MTKRRECTASVNTPTRLAAAVMSFPCWTVIGLREVDWVHYDG